MSKCTFVQEIECSRNTDEEQEKDNSGGAQMDGRVDGERISTFLRWRGNTGTNIHYNFQLRFNFIRGYMDNNNIIWRPLLGVADKSVCSSTAHSMETIHHRRAVGALYRSSSWIYNSNTRRNNNNITLTFIDFVGPISTSFGGVKHSHHHLHLRLLQLFRP